MKEYTIETKLEFLDVIKNYYNGIYKVNKVTDVDEMMDFAVMHQLNSIFAYILLQDKDFDGDKAKVRRSYLGSVQVNATRNREADKFASYLRSNNVPFSYIKGQYIKKYYKPSEVRSMGDADIYIPSEHMDTAKAYFEANGYEVKDYYESVTTYKKGFVEFEVHTAIEWFGVDWSKDAKLYFDGFDDKTELAFTIIHALKHIVGYGCGIRQVLDVAILLKNNSGLLSDSSFLADIDSIHITKCYETLIGLINRWFGTDYPVNVDKRAVDILESAVLDGGVFGKNLNDYATISTVQHKSKAKMYFRMLFPVYDRMVLSYPKLAKRKWLLPYYYMVRLFTRGIKEKRYKIVSANGGDKGLIDKRQEFVDSLDLDKQYYNNI